jgi:hypothetical protein
MLTELERQREAHAAVRARLWAKPKPAPKVIPIIEDATVRDVPIYRITANVPLGNVIQFPGLIVRPHIVHKQKPLIDDILRIVAHFYCLQVSDLKSDRRDALAVRARHVAIHLCRELTSMSLTFIGRKLKRDHSSILHGQQKMAHEVKRDERLSDEVSIVKMKISDLLSKWEVARG